MNRQRFILAALVFALLAASPGTATLTVYTDRTAWVARLSGNVVTNDDFGGDPTGDNSTPFTTATGVVFTAPEGSPISIQVLEDGLVNGSPELHFRDFAAGVSVTLPNNGRGFGFDYATAIEPWTVQVGDHATILSSNSSGFVGYVDDARDPINSFTLEGATGAQGGISLDNLSRTSRLFDAGELHNQGVRFVLEHLTSLPAQQEEAHAVVLELTKEYCTSVGQDCSWLKLPAKLPRNPQPLIDRLRGSRALRNRAEAVFAVVELRSQRPRNARSLRRFERTLNSLESSYQRPLNTGDTARLSNLVSVARASGRFWAAPAEGGLGGIDFLDIDRPGPTPIVNKIDWTEVVMADAAGCLAGVEAAPLLGEYACAVGAMVWSAANIVDQINI
jgi:hypothetical protein